MTLSLADVTATIKLLEKEKEKLETKKFEAGAYSGDLTLDVTYALVKAEAGEAYPQFKVGDFLVETILMYAQSLDSNKKKPEESLAWIDSLFGDQGVMGKLIRANKSAAVNNEIRSHFESEVEKCKLSFQNQQSKKPKEGNTTVNGTISVRPETVVAKRSPRGK
jgi:hypothetical protein